MKQVGIIGHGNLAKSFIIELRKHPKLFNIKHIWNQTQSPGVKPLTSLSLEDLDGLDLVIEAAHPQAIHDHVIKILQKTDLFICSSSALGRVDTLAAIREQLQKNPDRKVIIPSGEFVGAADVQKLSEIGHLEGLEITIIGPPAFFEVNNFTKDACMKAAFKNTPVVLYHGTARDSCRVASLNSYVVVAGAIAARDGHLERTIAKIIVDPRMSTFYIIDIEIKGSNGLTIHTRREYAVDPRNGFPLYKLLFSSMLKSFALGGGLHVI